MMELIIVACVLVGLGALATFLLATRIPEQLLFGGQDHGRYADLGEGNYASHTAPSKRLPAQPWRRLFASPRSRTIYNANPRRESLRHRPGSDSEACRLAFMHLDTLRGDAAPSTWLVRIVLNVAVSTRHRLCCSIRLEDEMHSTEVAPGVTGATHSIMIVPVPFLSYRTLKKGQP
jgi:hypothetical protein